METAISDKAIPHPCCIACTNCIKDFVKIVDLENAGLIIYRHTNTEDVNQNNRTVMGPTKTTEDIFILHNMKDTTITSTEFLPEMEKRVIACARCRKIMEHALKLLQKVPAINKNDIAGICDHCILKEHPCNNCDEAVRKFFLRKSEFDKENVKKSVIEWLSKIKSLFKDSFWGKEETSRAVKRSQSEQRIDELCRRERECRLPHTSTGERKPDIRKLLDYLQRPGTARTLPINHITYTPDKDQVSFNSRDFDYKNDTDQYRRDTAGKDRTFDKTKFPKSRPQNREYFVDDILAADYSRQYPHEKESIPGLRGRLDEEKYLSRTILKPDKHPQTAVGRSSAREDNYIAKKLPQLPAELLGTHKNKTGGMRTGSSDNKQSQAVLKPDKQYTSPREDIPKKSPQKPADKLLSNGKKKTSGIGNTYKLEKQFSFVFPKKTKSRKTLKHHKSSSELIQHTQDMRQTNREEEKRMNVEKKKTSEKKLESEEFKFKDKENKTESQEQIVNKDKENAKNADILTEKQKKDQEKQSKKIEKLNKSGSMDKLAAKNKSGGKIKKIGTEELKFRQNESITRSKEQIANKDKENAMVAHLISGREKKGHEKHKKDIATSATRKTNKETEKDEEKQGKENSLKKDNKNTHGMDESGVPLTKRKAQAALKEVPEAKFNESLKDDLKKAKEENALMRKMEQDANEAVKELGKPSKEKIAKDGIIQMDGKKFTMLSCSQDNLILNLVRFKQEGKQYKERLSEIMTPYDISSHIEKHHGKKDGRCLMCAHSDIELDIDERARNKDSETLEIIKGQKIYKLHTQLSDKSVDKDVLPLFYKSKYDEPAQEFATDEKKPQSQIGKSTKSLAESPEARGVIRYALSDRTFIDKGWTVLPIEKVVRKMNVYRMRPAQPEFDWFKRNKNKGLIRYDSGERLADFSDDGRGRWYYRNGRMALDYYDAEESNAQQRYVIYSNGEPDERGRSRPYTVLATFDYLGNGVVFDHGGKIRLKYNQTEGVVLDRNIDPVTQWKWHTLNDPPVLQQVMIDTQVTHKDPEILKMAKNNDPHQSERSNDDEMLAIEFDNFIKQKSKKITQTFKPFQIKMKALKINEHFSLKVLDQETVYLIYRDGKTNLKLNIGMALDHKEIVDTDTAELGEVANNLEKFPARTDSLAGLQKSVAFAERFERTRTERDRRLRPPDPSASADKFTAAASRPVRHPLRTVHSCNAAAGTTCDCFKYSRKPSSNNVYYNQRVN